MGNIKIVQVNQTFLDLSIELYGRSDYAFELAYKNNKSITDELTAGEVIFYENKIVDKRRIDLMKKAPATAYHYTAPTGVGEMVVGDSFTIG